MRQEPSRVCSSFDFGATSAVVLAIAESVLKPLLGPQKGKLANISKGDNAVSFEVVKLPAQFKPQGCKVITEVHAPAVGCGRERSDFYLVDVKGTLVRLTVLCGELGNEANVIGAIYTGDDKDAALRQALQHAKRLSPASQLSLHH